MLLGADVEKMSDPDLTEAAEMAPIQVLTNNLLYDFSQIPIPVDSVDEEQVANRDPGTLARSRDSSYLLARLVRSSITQLSF